MLIVVAVVSIVTVVALPRHPSLSFSIRHSQVLIDEMRLQVRAVEVAIENRGSSGVYIKSRYDYGIEWHANGTWHTGAIMSDAGDIVFVAGRSSEVIEVRCPVDADKIKLTVVARGNELYPYSNYSSGTLEIE
jgi:hypothetical protein